MKGIRPPLIVRLLREVERARIKSRLITPPWLPLQRARTWWDRHWTEGRNVYMRAAEMHSFPDRMR